MRRTSLSRWGVALMAGAMIAGCQLFFGDLPGDPAGPGGSTTSSGSSSSATSTSSNGSSGTGGLGGTGGTMATGGSPGGEVVWANPYDGTAVDAAVPAQRVTGLAVDKSGNVFLAGWFSAGSLDFKGSCAILSATTATVGFIVKLDAQGTCQKTLLVSAIGADAKLTAVAVDSTGHVFVAGSFGGIITLPGQPGQLTAMGGTDAFVASYDDDLVPIGNWSTIVTGAGDENIHMLTFADARVYAAGSFTETININGNNIPRPTSASQEGLVFGLDGANGNSAGSIPLGLDKSTDIQAVSVGPKGVALVGRTDGTVDFGGSMQTTAGGKDALFVSYPMTLGISPTARLFGDGAAQSATAVFAGASGTYVAGEFHGKLEKLAPNPPSSTGGDDVFLVDIDSATPHVVTLAAPQNEDSTVAGVVAAADGVVLAGTMGATKPELSIDGTLIDTFTTMGVRDIFVLKLALGLEATVWRRTLGGAGLDYDLSALALGPNGEIYIAGGYKGGFNLGVKTTQPGDGIFVAQLKAN